MTPAVRPASGQTLPLVGAGRTAGVIAIGSRDGGRSAAATEPAGSMPFGTKDVRSWFVGVAATHRASAGWALAATTGSTAAAATTDLKVTAVTTSSGATAARALLITTTMHSTAGPATTRS